MSNPNLDTLNDEPTATTSSNKVATNDRLVLALTLSNVPPILQPLILIAVGKAGNEPVRPHHFYRITTEDLIATGVSKSSVHDVFAYANENLMKQVIELRNKLDDGSEELVRMPWVAGMRYFDKLDYCELEFNDTISKFISTLLKTSI